MEVFVVPVQPEVWREVDLAAGASERLRAEGRELHFDTDAETGALVIAVRDLDGNVLGALGVEDAVAIACGDLPSLDLPARPARPRRST